MKQAKRAAATARSRDLLVAAEAGDVSLMKELKKTLSKKSIGQAVSNCLDAKVTH